jgi:SAM-dependent methyltransferase
VGLDFDPDETELARRSGVYQRVHTSGAENIQEPDNSFDFVFSNSVLEHIPDLMPVLAEVWRILKPGGRFVFTVPSSYFPEFPGGPNWLGRFATRRFERGAYLKAIDERLAHFRYWDQNTWRQSLSGVGLQLDHTSHYLTRPELQRWESMSNATSRALVRLIGKRPIEIQRQIGAKKGKPSWWIRLAGRIIGRCAVVCVSSVGNDTDKGACLLGVAIKK